MKIDINNLTLDADLLHQIITDLVNEVITLTDQNVSLQAQLALLKKQRFGKSSEKIDKEIAELETRIEEGELLEAASDQAREDKQSSTPAEEKPKNIPKRQKLPEHLEHIDEVSNPDPIYPDCGGEAFRKIADDVSETLEYYPFVI